MRRIAIIIIPVMFFSGCASMWEAVSIGKLNGKADEAGYNYEDTGVVADPYFLYVNRKNINQAVVYPNAACRSGEQQKMLLDYDSGEK